MLIDIGYKNIEEMIKSFKVVIIKQNEDSNRASLVHNLDEGKHEVDFEEGEIEEDFEEEDFEEEDFEEEDLEEEDFEEDDFEEDDFEEDFEEEYGISGDNILNEVESQIKDITEKEFKSEHTQNRKIVNTKTLYNEKNLETNKSTTLLDEKEIQKEWSKPHNIIEYVRQNRYCTLVEALQYYTAKEIDLAINTGRIYKTKNKLYM